MKKSTIRRYGDNRRRKRIIREKLHIHFDEGQNRVKLITPRHEKKPYFSEDVPRPPPRPQTPGRKHDNAFSETADYIPPPPKRNVTGSVLLEETAYIPPPPRRSEAETNRIYDDEESLPPPPPLSLPPPP